MHRAAPLVRAVEQHRDGVGDRAQQQQNPAGRVRRGGNGFGGFQGVDGSVLVALQKQLRADGGHRIHFGLPRFQVHARAGHGKVRQVGNVVAAARSGELEIAQGKGGVRDGGDAVAGAEFETVVCLHANHAAADFKPHEILVERRVFVEGDVVERQGALGTQRVEIKISAPREPFTCVRGAGERIRVFIFRVGAEILQRYIERADDPFERFARGVVAERGRGAGDLQPADAQRERLGRLGRCGTGRIRREFGDQVGEVQRVIPVDLHPGIGFGHADFLEDPGMAQEGRQLEVHINLVPRDEGLAVLVLDEQPAHGGRKRERIDFDFLNRNFAVELFGQLFDGDRADDRRQDEETENGVKKQQADNPTHNFVPSGRNRTSKVSLHHSLAGASPETRARSTMDLPARLRQINRPRNVQVLRISGCWDLNPTVNAASGRSRLPRRSGRFISMIPAEVVIDG